MRKPRRDEICVDEIGLMKKLKRREAGGFTGCGKTHSGDKTPRFCKRARLHSLLKKSAFEYFQST